MTWKHIEINAGTQVGPARLVGADGTQLDFRDMGQFGFWIDAVETDGGRITMHECKSYEEAIIAAEEMAREGGIRVIDLVTGGEA